ncbi:hypothetical protein BB559_003216 [Furculomyces boomerangus]|uniref:Dolichyl-phosphate-mannose--protein mannosyltransferase n=1 Tax=Furculomyces boomerangus TaxID=61424 RepID=A0A2T9YMN3_9FUNG|nr:hypothetical protein BB559_003216 [Furculomyces boomerangus]
MTSVEDASGLHHRKTATKGASPPVTPIKNATSNQSNEKKENPPISLPKILSSNAALAGLILTSIIAILPRIYLIWFPQEVVFDEVHFGKFASYYLRRQYYFDVHPPLAKMILAIPAKLVGYNGKFLFEKIGMNYIENGAPYFVMRMTVAMFGASIPILAYMIMAESGYSLAVSFITASLISLDNSLVLHSRLILLDSIMLFFMVSSIYSYIRFFKLRFHPFTTQWYLWLTTTGFLLGCAVSCKLVGLFTFSCVGIFVLYDLWRILDINRNTTISEFGKHFAARAVSLILVPIVVYLTFFYVHFSILTNTGPGDAYHTPNFQMQLAGNQLAMNTLPVYFGDSVSFKHIDTNTFISSRDEIYPLKYADGRVSSNGQQVTATGAETDESFWTVIPGELFEEYTNHFDVNGTRINDLPIPPESLIELKVRHNDVVRLLHKTTNCVLRTHDVAAPLTPTNMEFTCVNSTDEKAYKDTLFYLKFDQPSAATKDSEGNLIQEELRTSSKRFRIVSKSQNVAAMTHAKKLPKWGHGDQEINGKKAASGSNTLWTINTVSGKNVSDSEETKVTIPKMGFFAKFIELQRLMLEHNAKLTKPHPYQSTPASWPLMLRGVSFWTDSNYNRQIYFLGNPFGWAMSILGIGMFSVIILGILAGHRRNFDLVSAIVERHLMRNGLIFAICYAMHYLPFFIMGRALFIHHYLPSVVFGYMVLGSMLQFFTVDNYQQYALFSPVFSRINLPILPKSKRMIAYLGLVLALQFLTFCYFAPFVYGTTLTPSQVRSRKWLPSWDFAFTNK